MADKQMYVWSPIHHSDKKFKLGAKISKTDLTDISDDDWNYLVEAGSVRPIPYPTNENGNVVTKSPRLHALDQIAAMSTGEAYVHDQGSSSETLVVEPAKAEK